MGTDFRALDLRAGRLVLEDTGQPLTDVLEGLKQIRFIADPTDVQTLDPQTLVVGLGSIAGRTLRTVDRFAARLARRQAIGLVVHSRHLGELPSSGLGPEGGFPVLLVPASIDWARALAPLLRLYSELESVPVDAFEHRRDVIASVLLAHGRSQIDVHEALGMGLDLSLPFRAVVVDPHDDVDGMLDHLQAALEIEVLEHDPLGTTLGAGSVIVAVTQCPDPRVLADKLLARGRNESRNDLTVGIGNARIGTDGMFRSFREAAWAARVGHNMLGPNRVVELDEIGAYAWLEPIDFERKDDGTAAIARLTEHDARNGTRLLETLITYLEARRSKEAADRLFVHRNTLRYRLESIRKITGLDVRERDSRLILELQLRLAKIWGLIPEPVDNVVALPHGLLPG